MYRKKLGKLAVVCLMAISLCHGTVFAAEVGPGMMGDVTEIETLVREKVPENFSVSGRYAYDTTTGNVFYADASGNFTTHQLGSDGRMYDAQGAQQNTIMLIKERYLPAYEAAGENEWLTFESPHHLMLFVQWLQYDQSSRQGKMYYYNQDDGMKVRIQKKDLEAILEPEEVGYRERVDALVQQVDRTKSQRDIVNQAASLVANSFVYDLNTMDSSMMEALNNRRGVCWHYTKLLGDILEECSITNESVLGYNTDNRAEFHEWNKVYLSDEGKWVYVDGSYINQTTAYDRPGGNLKVEAGKEYILTPDAVLNQYHMLGYSSDIR